MENFLTKCEGIYKSIEKQFCIQNGLFGKYSINEHDFNAQGMSVRSYIHYVRDAYKNGTLQSSKNYLLTSLFYEFFKYYGYGLYYTGKNNLKRHLYRYYKDNINLHIYIKQTEIEAVLKELGMNSMDDFKDYSCSLYSYKLNSKEEYLEDLEYYYNYYKDNFSINSDYLNDLYKNAKTAIDKIDFTWEYYKELIKKYRENMDDKDISNELDKKKFFISRSESCILKLIGFCEFHINYYDELLFEVKQVYPNYREDYFSSSQYENILKSVMNGYYNFFSEKNLDLHQSKFMKYCAEIKSDINELKPIEQSCLYDLQYMMLSQKQKDEIDYFDEKIYNSINMLLGFLYLYSLSTANKDCLYLDIDKYKVVVDTFIERFSNDEKCTCKPYIENFIKSIDYEKTQSIEDFHNNMIKRIGFCIHSSLKYSKIEDIIKK